MMSDIYLLLEILMSGGGVRNFCGGGGGSRKGGFVRTPHPPWLRVWYIMITNESKHHMTTAYSSG